MRLARLKSFITKAVDLTVNEETRHRLIWGWLRLFLGFAQMSLVAMGIGALITVGVRRITVVLVILATTATVMSRLIYHGRPDPRLKGKEDE
jgi:hypothetical protein